MNWRRLTWLAPRRKKAGLVREAGAALFAGIRIRLTLWYCGVLGAALVLFSVALYFGVQYFLLAPIQNDAVAHAHAHVGQWVRSSASQACSPQAPRGLPPPPVQRQGPFMTELVACFDQHGTLLPTPDTTSPPSAFLNTTIVAIALRQGSASDIVNGGSSVGQIYRYALAVPDPSGHGNEGVVVIGTYIQAQENALSLLLILLLAVGGVALLGAGLGGLFLANRAMAPARLAWANQQRFIADAAHELRTPLTLLRADAEVLLRSPKHLAAEDAALLEDIVDEAKHMGNLASSLLSLARLDRAAIHREYEVVSLADLAQEAVRRVQAFAEQRGVSVHIEESGTTYVIGDPMLLEQAILVLLDNAIKYNRQDGCVAVRVVVQDRQALLEVCDSGIGISTEHLVHLGERFYRVDKARSREGGGTGLGLSIARTIIEAHGGQLSLASVFEQGTTVTLTLPLASGTRPDT